MLPEGCDCVIPIEVIEFRDGSARLEDAYTIDPMQNVHQRGSDRGQGDVLLDAGTVMFGPQCAVAATVGAREVSVGERPRIAIAGTGDELVAVGETPQPHQIRRSNGHALESLLAGAGFTDTERCHLPDDPEAIEQGLGGLLKTARVVLVSGGVSVGRFDHVPEVLGRLGVKQIFHQVRQRPGKPLWFGIGPEGQLVFGLPGNPVSGLVCCYRYVLPALWKSLGATLLATERRPHAALGGEIRFKRPLTLFKPVTVGMGPEGEPTATPLAMGGSGDLAGLAESDGFVELNAEQDVFAAGSRHPLYLWSDPYIFLCRPGEE
jgi:molybdopterin molybdotransferase